MYRTLGDVSENYDMISDQTAKTPPNLSAPYREISNFAPTMDDKARTDPLFYCLLDSMDAQFMHGSTGRIFGKYNENCSRFLTNRCALNWDNICESISKDKTQNFPNLAAESDYGRRLCLSYGDQLIRNVALQKFRVMATDCNIKCEPHDPTNPNSPMICFETNTPCSFDDPNCYGSALYGRCQPIYNVHPTMIDELDFDPVMNKILDRPQLGWDLLYGIYQTMKSENTLDSLQGTRLGRFLQTFEN